MSKDYTDVIFDIPTPPILARWPESGLEELWERAQQFALVLDQEGEWWLDRTWMICGDSSGSFDEMHLRKIVVPILDSTRCACLLDVPRLTASLRPRGVLAKAMRKIEKGRTLHWDEQRREWIGKLNKSALAAIESVAALVEEEPFRTDDSVMTVVEHLLGLEKQEPPDNFMQRHGLTIDSSEEEIMKAADSIEAELQGQKALAYGSYVDAVRQIIEIQSEMG